jgi:hypothetical protein
MDIVHQLKIHFQYTGDTITKTLLIYILLSTIVCVLVACIIFSVKTKKISKAQSHFLQFN